MFARRVSSQGLCPNIQGPKGLDWVICLVVLVAALAAIGPAVRPSWAGEKQWQTQHSKHQSDNTRSHDDANTVMYRNICASWLGVICLSPGLRDFCSARQNIKIQLACGPVAPLLGTFLAVSALLVATELHILFDAPRRS